MHSDPGAGGQPGTWGGAHGSSGHHPDAPHPPVPWVQTSLQTRTSPPVPTPELRTQPLPSPSRHPGPVLLPRPTQFSWAAHHSTQASRCPPGRVTSGSQVTSGSLGPSSDPPEPRPPAARGPPPALESFRHPGLSTCCTRTPGGHVDPPCLHLSSPPPAPPDEMGAAVPGVRHGHVCLSVHSRLSWRSLSLVPVPST